MRDISRYFVNESLEISDESLEIYTMQNRVTKGVACLSVAILHCVAGRCSVLQ